MRSIRKQATTPQKMMQGPHQSFDRAHVLTMLGYWSKFGWASIVSMVSRDNFFQLDFQPYYKPHWFFFPSFWVREREWYTNLEHGWDGAYDTLLLNSSYKHICKGCIESRHADQNGRIENWWVLKCLNIWSSYLWLHCSEIGQEGSYLRHEARRVWML